jgi:hypothetical protein
MLAPIMAGLVRGGPGKSCHAFYAGDIEIFSNLPHVRACSVRNVLGQVVYANSNSNTRSKGRASSIPLCARLRTLWEVFYGTGDTFQGNGGGVGPTWWQLFGDVNPVCDTIKINLIIQGYRSLRRKGREGFRTRMIRDHSLTTLCTGFSVNSTSILYRRRRSRAGIDADRKNAGGFNKQIV